MKIKNLLLLLVLLNGFAARPSFGAGVRVAPGELEVAGAEEHKGPDDEDAPLPAGAGTGLGGGAEGAAAGVVGGAEEPAVATGGQLAKIELLRGSLTGVPPAMQGASLLHGAMLWEMGIVKMLYVMLVRPKIVRHGAGARLEPYTEETLFELGKVLIELFRLTGHAFKPRSAPSAVVFHMTPTSLGRLYNSLIKGEAIEDSFSKRPKTVSRIDVEKYKKAFAGCREISKLNPKNVLPSIIMAFFWAKFVMGITLPKMPTLEEARENIKIFMQSAQAGLSDDTSLATAARAGGFAGQAVLGAGATVVEGAVAPLYELQDLGAMEAEVIKRINAVYQYNIPKPPLQGNAVIQPLPGTTDPRTFPDCGESGMRGLFCAAFYDRENKRFIVPGNTDSVLYASELRAYFEKYSTVEMQDSDDARNEWATLCSDQPGIIYNTYNKSDERCDLESSFENVMSLLGILVPGARPSDCNCTKRSGAASAAGGAGAGVVSLSTTIHDYACSEKILYNFCTLPGHNLVLEGMEYVQRAFSWKVTSTKSGNKKCSLYFKTHSRHMDCEFRTDMQSTFGQIQEPILGGSDAISIIPQNPDLIQPLVFAASRMAQHRNFFDGYIRMYRTLNARQRESLFSNIEGWRFFMLPEQRDLLKRFKNHGSLWFEAASRGYYEIVHKLLDHKDKLNFINKTHQFYDYTALTGAARNGHVEVVKLLLENKADINLKDDSFDIALIGAARNGHIEVVKLLLENKAEINLQDGNRDTALIRAARNGHVEIVRLLLENKADINLKNYKYNTALGAAVRNGHVEVVILLINAGIEADGKGKWENIALLEAAGAGHLELVTLLLDQGVDINCTDRYGTTPLLKALASLRSYEIVNLLLDRGAKYDPKVVAKYLMPKDLRERMVPSKNSTCCVVS